MSPPKRPPRPRGAPCSGRRAAPMPGAALASIAILATHRVAGDEPLEAEATAQEPAVRAPIELPHQGPNVAVGHLQPPVLSGRNGDGRGRRRRSAAALLDRSGLEPLEPLLVGAQPPLEEPVLQCEELVLH